VNAVEHLDLAEKAVVIAECCGAAGKFDRMAAYTALASVHVAIANAKEHRNEAP
jgi:hypothetical protein